MNIFKAINYARHLLAMKLEEIEETDKNYLINPEWIKAQESCSALAKLEELLEGMIEE